jgi:hypothetical protein
MPSALAGLFMRRLVPAPTLLGRQRSNSTHASTTDPEAQLYRKGPGKEAKLSFMGHAPMETPPCSGYAHYPRAGSLQRGVRETGRAECYGTWVVPLGHLPIRGSRRRVSSAAVVVQASHRNRLCSTQSAQRPN